MERGGKYEIEIKKGKRRNQIILLVNLAEMECLYLLSLHQNNSSQYHCEQQYDSECGQISLHDKARCENWFWLSNLLDKQSSIVRWRMSIGRMPMPNCQSRPKRS